MRITNRSINHRLASQMNNRIKMSRYDTLPRLCGSVIKFPKYKTIHRQMDSHSRR